MQISEIMHKGVVSVNAQETIQAVARLMRDEDLGSVPVYSVNEDKKRRRFIGYQTIEAS